MTQQEGRPWPIRPGRRSRPSGSLRTFRAQMKAYLDQARQGRSFAVTSHGVVIAEIRPPSPPNRRPANRARSREDPRDGGCRPGLRDDRGRREVRLLLGTPACSGGSATIPASASGRRTASRSPQHGDGQRRLSLGDHARDPPRHPGGEIRDTSRRSRQAASPGSTCVRTPPGAAQAPFGREHRDPFGPMLIAQAMAEQAVLVSDDPPCPRVMMRFIRAAGRRDGLSPVPNHPGVSVRDRRGRFQRRDLPAPAILPALGGGQQHAGRHDLGRRPRLRRGFGIGRGEAQQAVLRVAAIGVGGTRRRQRQAAAAASVTTRVAQPSGTSSRMK